MWKMWLRGLLMIVAILDNPQPILSETDNANEEPKDMQTYEDYSSRANEVPQDIHNDNSHLLIGGALSKTKDIDRNSLLSVDHVPLKIASEKRSPEPCIPLNLVFKLLTRSPIKHLHISSSEPKPKVFKLPGRLGLPLEISSALAHDVTEHSSLQSQPETPSDTEQNSEEILPEPQVLDQFDEAVLPSLASTSYPELSEITFLNHKETDFPGHSKTEKILRNWHKRPLPTACHSKTPSVFSHDPKSQLNIQLPDGKFSELTLEDQPGSSFFKDSASNDELVLPDTDEEPILFLSPVLRDLTEFPLSKGKSIKLNLLLTHSGVPSAESQLGVVKSKPYSEPTVQIKIPFPKVSSTKSSKELDMTDQSLLSLGSLPAESLHLCEPLFAPLPALKKQYPGESITESESTELYSPSQPYFLPLLLLRDQSNTTLIEPALLNQEHVYKSVYKDQLLRGLAEVESGKYKSNVETADDGQPRLLEELSPAPTQAKASLEQSYILQPEEPLPNQSVPLEEISPEPSSEQSLKQLNLLLPKQSDETLVDFSPAPKQTEVPFESFIDLRKQSEIQLPNQSGSLEDDAYSFPGQSFASNQDNLSSEHSQNEAKQSESLVKLSYEPRQADLSLEQTYILPKQPEKSLPSQSEDLVELSPASYQADDVSLEQSANLPNQPDEPLPNQSWSLEELPPERGQVEMLSSEQPLRQSLREQSELLVDLSSAPRQFESSLQQSYILPQQPEEPVYNQSGLLGELSSASSQVDPSLEQSYILLKQADMKFPNKSGSLEELPSSSSQADVSLEQSYNFPTQHEIQFPNQYESLVELSSAPRLAEASLEQLNTLPIQPDESLLSQYESPVEQSELLEKLSPAQSQADGSLEQSYILPIRSEESESLEKLSPVTRQAEASLEQSYIQSKLAEIPIPNQYELTPPTSQAETLSEYSANLLEEPLPNQSESLSELSRLRKEIDYYRAIFDQFRSNGYKSKESKSSIRFGPHYKLKPKECEEILQGLENTDLQLLEQSYVHDEQVPRRQNVQNFDEEYPDAYSLPGQSYNSQNVGVKYPKGVLSNWQSLKHQLPREHPLVRFMEGVFSRALPVKRQFNGRYDSEVQSYGTQDPDGQLYGQQDATEEQFNQRQESIGQFHGTQDPDGRLLGRQDLDRQFHETQDPERQFHGKQDSEVQLHKRQDPDGRFPERQHHVRSAISQSNLNRRTKKLRSRYNNNIILRHK